MILDNGALHHCPRGQRQGFAMRSDQIDFDTATQAVRQAKKGTPSKHPIRGDELRALRRLTLE